MRKAIIIICGLFMLLGGAGGLFVPVYGYFWAREWATFFFAFGFPFFPVFYLPFAGWLLVTGVGLLAGRPWAWYSVQTFWVFLLCIGGLALVGLNLLFPLLPSVVDLGARMRMTINAALGLLLVLIPVGGLVFFDRARPDFTAAGEEPPRARRAPAAEEWWSD